MERIWRQAESDIPGVEDFDAAAVVVRDIAGGNRRSGGAGYRGDLGIELRDREAGAAAVGRDARVCLGRVAAEGQDAACEILPKHRLGGAFEGVASLAFGQQCEAVQDFRLRDAGGVKRRSGLRRNPAENTPGRRRLHQFGNDVGVEDDHRTGYFLCSLGGSRIGSRPGTESSTPPSGSKRRRIACARSFDAAASSASAARRMWRTSSSIERLRCAARTLRRALVCSSRFRIVILAIGFTYLQSLIAL